MGKVFKNKTFAYIIAGALMILQLCNSIGKWCNGGFNGGSLILCLLMIGLLACTAIGINKNKNLLMAISGAAILSVFIYVKANDVSGFVIEASKGTMTPIMIVHSTFVSLGTILLIWSLIFAIMKAFGYKKDLRLLNAILCIIAFACFFIPVIPSIVESGFTLSLLPEVIFSILLPLLVACVGYQLEFKE